MGDVADGNVRSGVAQESDVDGAPLGPAPDRPWPGPGDDAEDLVADPLPEADSDRTAQAWEDAGAMDGEAPTG